jgi:hypothetical protein
MRGAIAVSAKRDDLEIMAGSADSLTFYQFGSMTAYRVYHEITCPPLPHQAVCSSIE